MNTHNVSRRAVLAGGTACALGAVVGPVLPKPRDSVAVTGLKVDNLIEPLGLENRAPRLSWLLTGGPRGLMQTAYRILVASDPARLVTGLADLWDSGRVNSAATFDVRYAGKSLASRQLCHWRIEVRTNHDTWIYSESSQWEMGLLNPQDWTASWLAAEDPLLAADREAGLNWIWGEAAATQESRGFRLELDLHQAPRETLLMVVACDELGDVWVNDRELSFARFKPSPVNNARMYSIPLALFAGHNVLAISARYKADAWPKSGGGSLAAVLRVTHADGRLERITTGPNWHTGPLLTGWPSRDFRARSWTTAQPATFRPAFDPWRSGPAMLLRHRFTVLGTPVRARLYVTALGAVESRLNGQRVGDALLTPESTDFSKRVLYRVYDVLTLLRRGENILSAIVGDGWYGSTGLFAGRYSFGPAPNRVLAQLELTRSDGRIERIGTGPGWQLARSPILAAEIYDGEVYDARLEQQGWDSTDFDGSAWDTARAAPTPSCALVAAVDSPIRITGTLAPISVKETRPGIYVFDFGQNFAGWCLLRGQASSGTCVQLRFAEILTATGEIDQSNLRAAEACDCYIFRGDPAGETYRPRFTYHGFRYVELSGWPGNPAAIALTGEVIHSDLELTGVFQAAAPLLERLWRNTLWGQRSNFVGIPTDCPQRDERLGWMGDAQIFWDAACFNMNADAFTRRFMGDVRDAQTTTGVFAEFNPQTVDANMRGAPGWADAGILLPWTVWWRYGDTAIIEENWQAMYTYAQLVAHNNPDMLWRNGRGSDYGDWLALDARQPGDETTPKELIATAFWAESTAKLAQMAEAIGRAEEASSLRIRHAAIAAAFRRQFLNADGTIGNGSQTGYILPLRFGLLSPGARATAQARLVADIRRRGMVLSTGFLGTPHALDVLADAGYAEIVRALLERTTYPSWGYMVVKGATTMWERWNGDVGDISMNSFNHYALGAVVGFFYRHIAGIDAGAPGFRRIVIKPGFDLGLRSAGAQYESVAGTIATHWSLEDSSFELRLTVPCSTRAEVHVPGSNRTQLFESGRPLTKEFRLLRQDARSTVIEVGGGRYAFSGHLGH